MECPSPIIVHRCLWEPKEQEQGIRGTTLRGASDWRCSRSWRKSSGAVISAQHPRTPQGPTSPCAAAPARHVRLISSRYSKPILGGSPDPASWHPLIPPEPQLQIEFPDCHMCQPAGLPRTIWPGSHLSCNLVWRCPISSLPHVTIAQSFNQHRPKWAELTTSGGGSNCATYCPPDNKPRDAAIKRPFDQSFPSYVGKLFGWSNWRTLFWPHECSSMEWLGLLGSRTVNAAGRASARGAGQKQSFFGCRPLLPPVSVCLCKVCLS